jgi:hypothetical protein
MFTIVTHPVRLAAALSVAASVVGAQTPSSSAPAAPAIRLSQIGFLPAAPKVAVVVGASCVDVRRRRRLSAVTPCCAAD